MTLPNLISVSVMPGCSASAEVHAASDSRAAKANFRAGLLDLIMDVLPGAADFCCLLCNKAKPEPKNRSFLQMLDRAMPVATEGESEWRCQALRDKISGL